MCRSECQLLSLMYVWLLIAWEKIRDDVLKMQFVCKAIESCFNWATWLMLFNRSDHISKKISQSSFSSSDVGKNSRSFHLFISYCWLLVVSNSLKSLERLQNFSQAMWIKWFIYEMLFHNECIALVTTILTQNDEYLF